MHFPDQKKAIALCGFMACGKSTLGRLLADALGWPMVDTDEMLLSETGMTIPEMFKIGGEAYFRDREHEIVRKAARLQNTVISTGGGVMTFERNALLLSESCVILHIDRRFDDCHAAILCRKNRPIGQKSRDELFRMYLSRRAAYTRYADYTLRNDARPEDALRQILGWLRDECR